MGACSDFHNNSNELVIITEREKLDNLFQNKKKFENNIIQEEVLKRAMINNSIDKKEKFDLNIYIYSDTKIQHPWIYKSIRDYNEEVFNWKIKDYVEYSQKNTEKIIDICESDFKEKQFKNIVILPIKSFSDFTARIEQEGKDFLASFNDLNEENQPFFLIIDEDINDFNKNIEKEELEEIINMTEKYEKEYEENVYNKFMNRIAKKIFDYKSIEKYFEVKIEFCIYELKEIELLKECILNKKNNNDDFEFYINNVLYYKYLYGLENIEMREKKNKKNLEEKLNKMLKSDGSVKISFLLYNVNLEENLTNFEQFDVHEVEFITYSFNNQKLNHILRKKKYEYLDKRNFDVIKSTQLLKNNLLKYTGYFNQLGDVIFYEQIQILRAKINIAIGGYIGSGKSTLINTIFGEKRCLEGQGGSQTIYISKMALRDYPINFIDFPGFRGKKDGKSNISLFVEEIMNKISDLKKLNEVVHCFLFCIKFEERIFDENDEDMKEVFDAIIELKIRTFFIITGSEKEDNKKFKKFKYIVVNNLNKVKEKYPKEKEFIINKIFGDDVNKSIIPILLKDTTFHEFTANAFGLDILFKKLYEYFLDKKINFEKEIFFDDEKLKEFIKNNELLQIFESKKKLMNDFKNKIQIEAEKFILKIFIKAPKYIYNFSNENN